jgi:microcystin-dependent protein
MDAFVGEIRSFSFGFIPKGWLPCDGKIYPVSGQYGSLAAILGTLYGGTPGQSFAVPNLQGATLAGWGMQPGGDEYAAGQSFGQATVALSTEQMPAHNHGARAKGPQAIANMHTAPAAGDWLSGCVLTEGAVTRAWKQPPYAVAPSFIQMVGSTGGGQPHENRHPYLATPIGICCEGLWPERSQP